MKKISRILIVATLCLSLMLSMFAFAACGEEEKPPEPPAAKTYEVIFSRNCDDDRVVEPDIQKVEEGKTATKPADPTRLGFELEGWYIDEDCTEAFDFSTPITGETVLFANWVTAVTRYTVTFDYKGGTGTPATATVASGAKVEKPADPTKSGSVFDGWYLDEAFGNAYSFDAAVEGSFTLYAKWLDEVKLTYNLNYDNKTEEVVLGKGQTPAAYTPARDGYTFGGWFTDAACTDAYTRAAVNTATTVYAKWISADAQTFTYTFNYNYEGAPAATQVPVAEGALVVVPSLESVTPEGKAFGGWYTDAACTTAFDVNVPAAANATLYAKWNDETSVTFNPNYTGANVTKVAYEAGEAVTKPADPVRAGYTFAGWATKADIEPDFTFGASITESITLYAQWSRLYTFEAEDTNLNGVDGWGFSGNAAGTDTIVVDEKSAGASNGRYLYCLNAPGLEIVFNFTSDRDATNVKFTIRLSAEIKDIKISHEDSDDEDTGKVTMDVNGTPIEYGTIAFTGVPAQSSGDVLAFKDFTFTVNLKKGENTVKIIMDNEKGYQGGTMKAIAPMIDCIKLETSAVLSFTPKSGNY